MQPKQPKAETQAMSEYGEPWRYDPGAAEDEHFIRDGAGGVVVECVAGDVLYEDIVRIVACVNSLAGIPNPEAVRELIRWAKIWNVTLETDEAHWEAEFQMSEALAALTAPSASPQQK